MVRASINVVLGGILERSEGFGRIYGWIPSGHLVSSVTPVPYFEELCMERNTKKLKLARIALKRLQTPLIKHKLFTQQKR